ncbi:MAG: ABC transporter ATP-binding protein [Alphaproteobacteria bacterium]|nr:ABC transporter ATP-binding protein [Alphaproteobacteria bacterium]
MAEGSMIEVADLRVSFGRGASLVHAVDGVSFGVREGETFGLVGESGCGKSTVLRALCGLNPEWSGGISFGGVALARPPDRGFFRRVQMVFQDPFGSLHPRHTVNTTLGEPLAIHGIGDRDRRIVEVLEQVGLGPAFRYRYPHQLSGGQRQRLAIARALILEPRVLLLDEPTSALDVSVQAEILNLLTDMRRARGLTCILVSHDLAVVAHMCDRLAVMMQGRIVEELDVAALAAGRTVTDYATGLLAASRGYDRQLAARFVVEDGA